MTDPFDEPTGRWGLIFHGSGMYRSAHTRQEWAQIADAIRTADAAAPDDDEKVGVRGAAAPDDDEKVGVRGDEDWCRRAIATYDRLHEAGAYAHLRPGDEPRWHADEPLIRAWLDAPVVPGDAEPATMLDAYGWQDTFDPARTPDPADLTILAYLAQDAGVVGAPHHRVSLLRWVQGGVTRDDAFLVLLWPPESPARGSSAVGLDQLIQPAHAPADTIVGFLQSVAQVTNRLLDATIKPDASRRPNGHYVEPVEPPPVPEHVQGWRLGNPARVFPPLRLVHPAPATGDPPIQPAPPQPRPHR